MKVIPISFLFGIFSIGCGSSGTNSSPIGKTPEIKRAKITTENQRSLLPLAEGNTWTYSLEATADIAGQPKKSASGTVEYRISKVFKDSPTSVRAIMDVYQGDKKTDEQEWGVDDKGISQISVKPTRQAFSTRQIIIRFPVKDQDSYRWEGTGITAVGRPGSMRLAFKNDGTQDVDTEMGQMNAVFIQNVGSFKANDGTLGNEGVNSWYSPGVGLVRYRQEIRLKNVATVITLRLKSYNVKK